MSNIRKTKGMRRITVNVYRVTALKTGETWEGVSNEFPKIGEKNNGCPVKRNKFSTLIKKPEKSKSYKVEIVGRRKVLRKAGITPRRPKNEPIKLENDRCYTMKGGVTLVWMRYDGETRCERCFLAYHEECEKAPCQEGGIRGFFRLKGGKAL